jgi:hypothetical protein
VIRRDFEKMPIFMTFKYIILQINKEIPVPGDGIPALTPTGDKEGVLLPSLPINTRELFIPKQIT